MFHILCMERYEFYLSDPSMIKRAYATWGFDGETLRVVSRQELVNAMESVPAALAIFCNVQALLAKEAYVDPLPEMTSQVLYSPEPTWISVWDSRASSIAHSAGRAIPPRPASALGPPLRRLL